MVALDQRDEQDSGAAGAKRQQSHPESVPWVAIS
jgi:hypothetical protein